MPYALIAQADTVALPPVTEVRLGLAPEGVRHGVFSPDGLHVAVVAGTDGNETVVFDGKSGPAFDRVDEGTLTFSPDLKHLAYVGHRGDKEIVVWDGVEGPQFNGIGFSLPGDELGPLVFSADSQHLAYVAINWSSGPGSGSYLVLDGKTHPTVQYRVDGRPQFSPDGRHLAYSVGSQIVVDDQPGPLYDRIYEWAFSPDWKHLAYAAKKGDKVVIVQDGTEGPAYDGFVGDTMLEHRPPGFGDGPGVLLFQADGSLAFAVKKGPKWFAIVGGKESPGYDSISGMMLSPDRKRILYSALKGDKWVVVVDGVESPPYASVDAFLRNGAFSSDSKHVYYLVKNGSESAIMKDGKFVVTGSNLTEPLFDAEGNLLAYQYVNEGRRFFVLSSMEHPIAIGSGTSLMDFSANGRHFAFRGTSGGQNFGPHVVVVDGKESPDQNESLSPAPILFSPDSQHVAYTFTNNGLFLKMDDITCGPYGAVLNRVAIFSPDSRHLAYAVHRGRHWVAVLDGKEGPEFDEMYGLYDRPDGQHDSFGGMRWKGKFTSSSPGLSFLPDGTLEYLAGRDHVLYRVQQPVPSAPAADLARRFQANYEASKAQVPALVEVPVQEELLAVLPDGASWAKVNGDRVDYFYTVKRDGKSVVVYDGKEGLPYDGIGRDYPQFDLSQDGTRLAYAAQKNAKMVIVIDGVEGPEYDRIDGPSFSPHGLHVAYIAYKGDRRVAVIDGKGGPEFDEIRFGTPIFSPDGARVAYLARKGDQWFAIVDGVQSPAYLDIRYLGFSPDGKNLAYAARKVDGTAVVINGRETAVYPEVNYLAVGSDERNVAVVIPKDKGMVVIYAGKEGKKFDRINGVALSPDESRLAYWADVGSLSTMVIDGVESPPSTWDYAGNNLRRPAIFSADSRHVLYFARRNERSLAVVDGIEGPANDKIFNGILSPDGQHAAYVVMNSGEFGLVLDGIDFPPFHSLALPTFSANSQHSAFVRDDISEKGRHFVMVDGKSGPEYDRIQAIEDIRDDGNVVYQALRGQSLYRVTQPASPSP